MPKITITRDRGYYAKMRALKLYVDNTHVAKIKQGQTIEIDVPDKSFVLLGKMDWAKTNALHIERAREGEKFTVRAWFTLNPLRFLGLVELPMRIEPDNSVENVFS